MGGVSEPANLTRTAPVAATKTAPVLSGLAQAIVGIISQEPDLHGREQAGQTATQDPARAASTLQPQLQAMVLLQTPGTLRPTSNSPPDDENGAGTGESSGESESGNDSQPVELGQNVATRQFHLAQQLYDNSDAPPQTFSIVG